MSTGIPDGVMHMIRDEAALLRQKLVGSMCYGYTVDEDNEDLMLLAAFSLGSHTMRVRMEADWRERDDSLATVV